MLTAETVHAESPRYAASIVCVPGVWARAAVWRGFASYLGHRGWECHLLDAHGMPGGLAARAAAVAEYAAALANPPVLVGHDAGGLVAVAAAARRPPAALVLLAPLAPRTRAGRLLVLAPRRLLALVVGGDVPPPRGRAAALWLDLPEPFRSRVLGAVGPDDAAIVRDVVWGRAIAPSPTPAPALVLAGARDRLVPLATTAALARAAGAELRVLADVGHWPLAGPGWEDAVARVHRWLVQRLGAPLLDLYAEAMAERDGEDGGET